MTLPADPDFSALLQAVQTGDATTVVTLVGRRRELVKLKDPDGQTALHIAAQCNDARIGVILLAAGADLETTFGDSGHTALSWAVTCNAMDFASVMRRMGAVPDLFCAAGMGALDAVQAWFDDTGVLKAGAARTGSSRYGPDGARLPCPPATAVEQISDALYIGCRNAHVHVVRFLLSGTLPSGARFVAPNVAFRAYNGGTPLHWAYFSGSREVVDLLLGAGANPNLLDEKLQVTPRAFGICSLAGWGFGRMVRARLDADPTLARIVEGTSPLHEAAREGHAQIVEMLCAAAADAGAQNRDGRTALDLALAGGHEAVAAVLRARG